MSILPCHLHEIDFRSLGLTRDGRGIAPCPSCGAERRGSSDSRPPIGIRPDDRGWRCHACGRSGDAVALLCIARFGTTFGKGDIRWRELALTRPTRPPRTSHAVPTRTRPTEDPTAVWLAAVARAQRELEQGSVAVEYLTERTDADAAVRLIRAGAVGAATRPALGVCLAVALRDFAGDVRDVGFRRAGPKEFTRIAGAAKYAGRPLVMMLPGLLMECDGGELWIVEGVIDWLTATSLGLAALGIPGASSATTVGVALRDELLELRHEGVSGPCRVFVSTHADPAGDGAAAALARELAPIALVDRIPLAPGQDLNDWATEVSHA